MHMRVRKKETEMKKEIGTTSAAPGTCGQGISNEKGGGSKRCKRQVHAMNMREKQRGRDEIRVKDGSTSAAPARRTVLDRA